MIENYIKKVGEIRDRIIRFRQPLSSTTDEILTDALRLARKIEAEASRKSTSEKERYRCSKTLEDLYYIMRYLREEYETKEGRAKYVEEKIGKIKEEIKEKK